MSTDLVNSRVVRLQPRLRRIEEAIAAYRNGSPSDCLDALHGHDDVAARVLRARAFLRTGQANGAVSELGVIDEADLYNEARAEVLTLRAGALTMMRRFAEAREALDLARIYTYGSGSAALETEYHVFESAFHFAAGDYTATEAAARSALGVRPAYLDRNTYFVPRGHSVARALHVCGLAAYAAGTAAAQTSFLREALAAMAACDVPDLWIRASLLKQLAFAVRDFDLVDDAATLREAIAGADDWPLDLDPIQFEIHRSLGWSSALRGDHLNAFGAFRKAGRFAQTDAWKIMASVDRAFLTRELGEEFTAREELEHAAALAARTAWETVGEERIGLALLAAEISTFDPSRGAALYARYGRIATRLSPYDVNSFDKKVRAHEAFAEATVRRATGAENAAARFEEAFDIWNRLGYGWLAATAALELWSMTGSPPHQSYACREAALRPHSWLARRAAALAPQRSR